MGLLKGALTVRRYRPEGHVPDDFRTSYQEALQRHAFHEPSSATFAGETVGWVLTQNLLDTDFDNHDRWLFNQYLVAALRVDKKVIPAKLFRAHLQKRQQGWCEEHSRERCPAAVRTELRDILEAEMLARVLPRVQVYEFCWNVADGWVVLDNTSDAANDRFRKLFHATFGIALQPLSPLELVSDPAAREALEIQGLSDLRPSAEDSHG